MANVDAPFGLRAVRHRDGRPYTGSGNWYFLPSSDSTAMFIGDPVTIAGSANTAEVEVPGVGKRQPGTLPTVVKSTAGTTNLITGVIVGFAADPNGLETIHRPASTDRACFVCDDPDVLFEVQEDSVGGDLAVTNIGQNITPIFGAGSATTGLSGAEIDTSSAATTQGFQLRIVGLADKPDNEIGTNANWLVTINQHSFGPNTDGV